MADLHQIDSRAQALEKVTAAAFGAKCSSKREVYRFLSHEAAVYLPAYDSVTVWHMRDIMAKKRRKVLCADVKVLNVP